MPSTRSEMAIATVSSRPDDLTALPRDRPPAARMMIVQGKLLKSSLVRMPTPKNNTIGMIAMTPMSPNTPSSWWLAHHSAIVAIVTMVTNHCTPVNFSLCSRIGTIVVPRPGWKVTNSKIQMSTMEMIPTGITMKNHWPHPGSGTMIPMATTFCGDAMGLSMPPILDARAIPISTALHIFESEGRFRSMGWGVFPLVVEDAQKSSDEGM